MSTEVIGRDRTAINVRPTAPGTESPDTLGVAQRAWTRALESCATIMGLESTEAVADQIRQGNRVARMHCCRGLAEQAAASLRSSHHDIRAVFAPDCDGCPQGFCPDEHALNTPSVHLLIWAQDKTPALSSRAAVLANALARVCQDVVGTHELPTVLDVQWVDSTDLERLFGAGRRERWPARLQSYLMAMDGPVEEL